MSVSFFKFSQFFRLMTGQTLISGDSIQMRRIGGHRARSSGTGRKEVKPADHKDDDDNEDNVTRFHREPGIVPALKERN